MEALKPAPTALAARGESGQDLVLHVDTRTNQCVSFTPEAPREQAASYGSIEEAVGRLVLAQSEGLG